MYLAGDSVAQNKQLLDECKITHIINCSGDYSDSYFPEDYIYKTYYLKDSIFENIECTFYDAIKFIEECAEKRGRVLVHCVQGVSRSATICMAYLIYARKFTHIQALEKVQNARSVASPNMIFLTQVIWWYKRLYQDYPEIPVNPRVFAIGIHQIDHPYYIAARLLMEHMYLKNSTKALDPRGVFLIQTETQMFLWIGDNLAGDNRSM